MDAEREQQIHIAVTNIARDLLGELRHAPKAGIERKMRLDKDLGMDSLTRVEFLRRVERQLNIDLPVQEFAQVDTIQDLEGMILHSAQRADLSKVIIGTSPDLGEVEAAVGASTLLDILDLHCQTNMNRPQIQFYQDDGQGVVITYGDLDRESAVIASYFLRTGLNKEEPVIIMLPTSPDYFYVFWGVLKAGGVPVPIYPPARLTQIEDHLRRHIGILQNCEAGYLVTIPEGRPFSNLLKAHAPKLRLICTPEEMRVSSVVEPRAKVEPGQTAFLQYTSGSTGQPKGVILSHANLLNSIRAMGDAIQASSRDIFVSWLPLYHDMGLIGAWFGTLYYGAKLVVMPPLSFLSRPERWLWAIHHHRATLTAAPNFAYEIALRKINDQDIRGLDLSSLRLCFDGAEPISPQSARDFGKRFSSYSLRKNAMMPVYGLAENSLAVTFPLPGSDVKIDRISALELQRDGVARPAQDSAGSLEFVSVGSPLKDNEIRIVDERGHDQPERIEGRLQFRSPSATKGYIQNPEKTAELIRDGWLDTGDLAYIADGDLYITGRTKDIVIRAGRKIHPFEIEDAIGRLAGIRRGGVVVFGVYDEAAGTERLVVLVETPLTDFDRRESLRDQINAIVTDQTGTPPEEIEFAPPRTVLKTSSGKIRRSACRDLYLSGRIGHPPSLPMRMAGLYLSSLLPRIGRIRRASSEKLYSAYAWSVFGLSLFPALVLLGVVHDHRLFRRALRANLNACLTLAGLKPGLGGQENLERLAEVPIILANHSSYLDSLVLFAVLDFDLRFVAKVELAKNPLLRLLLNRLDTVYVERFEWEKSVRDAENLFQAAEAGQALMIFPEGTFVRRPGLMRFHLGAFEIAARATRPLLPVVINGTRKILHDGSWVIYRGKIDVEICEPVLPLTSEASTWTQALQLSQLARHEMIERIKEPDLEPGPSGRT